ncbi:MAG: hypothetical protein IPP64_05455 [Bacteroidetes bacterium]|nr:hypothetical protein [Bacteroidota bacterium]
MKLLFTFLLLFSFGFSQSQTDSTHRIKVHFLYGSKPLKKYKNKTEMKYFGGIHGGHVTIEIDSIDYGFSPTGRVHMISHHRNCHSQYNGKHTHNQPPYPKGYKVVSFTIPISEEQYNQLNKIHSDYLAKPPYDYAFFGMRCAAATQDILSQIGIVKKKKRLNTIYTTFYPKKLRKRMFKLAEEKNYIVDQQTGRPTRKWESD